MFIDKGELWAGTGASLHALTEAVDRLYGSLASGNVQPETFFGVSEAPAARLEVTADGTAIIPVKGKLLNQELPGVLAELFGVTTYPSLQRQFAEAAADPTVKRVVLDVNSGGGAVSGLTETVDALSVLKSQKPVSAYVSDVCCSAAYWLASASGSITASAMSEVGSIGVIAVHMEAKESYEREGLKPTVFRSGAKKHLGHALEELTDEARADIQKHMDFIHGKFIEAVATNRSLPLLVAEKLGDGSVYHSEEAIQAGLIDRVSTFSNFLAGLEAPASKPNYQPSGFAADNGEPTMTLEQALARIGELEGEQAASQTALAAAETRAAEAETKVAALEASNTALSTSLAAADADRQAFAEVLEANIKTMGVALNAEVLIPEDLQGKQAYFAQVKEKFQAAFPAGGVAAANLNGGEASEAAAPEWLTRVVKG